MSKFEHILEKIAYELGYHTSNNNLVRTITSIDKYRPRNEEIATSTDYLLIDIYSNIVYVIEGYDTLFQIIEFSDATNEQKERAFEVLFRYYSRLLSEAVSFCYRNYRVAKKNLEDKYKKLESDLLSDFLENTIGWRYTGNGTFVYDKIIMTKVVFKNRLIELPTELWGFVKGLEYNIYNKRVYCKLAKHPNIKNYQKKICLGEADPSEPKQFLKNVPNTLSVGNLDDCYRSRYSQRLIDFAFSYSYRSKEDNNLFNKLFYV